MDEEAIRSGRNDFLHFWAGAVLAGSPDLYNAEAERRVHVVYSGGDVPVGLGNVRLPFYYLLLKPLTLFPYGAAYVLFQTVTFSVFWLWVVFASRRWAELPLLAAVSWPLVLSIENAQDATLVAGLAGFAVALASRRRDFAAGMLLALCAIKFHLFLLAPFAVVRFRRWGILRGGAAMALVLVALSAAGGGVDFPAKVAAAATSVRTNPNVTRMATLHGVSASLGLPFAAEVALAAAVAAAALVGIWRSRSLERAMGVALVAGPLFAVHAYVQDCVVAVVGAALLVAHLMRRMTRGLLIASLLPPAYFFLIVADPPWNVLTQALLCAAVAALAWERSSDPVEALEDVAQGITQGDRAAVGAAHRIAGCGERVE